MTLSRHPRTLIDILRRREGENAQAALLADDPAVVSGSNQGTSTTGGASVAAQAIEARSGDPTGADLYEGRVWEIGGVFKFFTGALTRLLVLTASGKVAPADMDVTGATESGDAIVTGVSPGFVPAFTAQFTDILIYMDGSGTPVPIGAKMDIVLDFACVLLGWVMTSDAAATARVDLWKTTYAGAPPTVTNTLIAANADKPQLAAAVKATGGVTGWTPTAIAAGDVIRVNLDTNNVATRLSLSLKVRRT